MSRTLVQILTKKMSSSSSASSNEWKHQSYPIRVFRESDYLGKSFLGLDLLFQPSEPWTCLLSGSSTIKELKFAIENHFGKTKTPVDNQLLFNFTSGTLNTYLEDRLNIATVMYGTDRPNDVYLVVCKDRKPTSPSHDLNYIMVKEFDHVAQTLKFCGTFGISISLWEALGRILTRVTRQSDDLQKMDRYISYSDHHGRASTGCFVKEWTPAASQKAKKGRMKSSFCCEKVTSETKLSTGDLFVLQTIPLSFSSLLLGSHSILSSLARPLDHEEEDSKHKYKEEETQLIGRTKESIRRHDWCPYAQDYLTRLGSLCRTNRIVPASKMYDTFNKSDFSDVKIRIYGILRDHTHSRLFETIHLHRAVLASYSTVLTRMMKPNSASTSSSSSASTASASFSSSATSMFEEQASGMMDIYEKEPDDFVTLISFMYGGVHTGALAGREMNMFTMAEKYDVRELMQICVSLIQPDTCNWLSVYRFAEHYHLTGLIRRCSALIQKDQTRIVQEAVNQGLLKDTDSMGKVLSAIAGLSSSSSSSSSSATLPVQGSSSSASSSSSSSSGSTSTTIRRGLRNKVSVEQLDPWSEENPEDGWSHLTFFDNSGEKEERDEEEEDEEEDEEEV